MDDAITQYQQLMEGSGRGQPDLLARLLALLRRAGRLHEAEPLLARAEAAAGASAGLHYCRGLLAWWVM
jgi:hypothetical protein